MKVLFSVIFFFSLMWLHGQYNFSDEVRLDCSAIKSQDKTGTCWSFSTVSFLESELTRQGHEAIDLSEMYIVRTIYQDKARNYVLRQGKANFSQGSLAHDVLRAYDMAGILPEEKYSGLANNSKRHNHSQLEKVLKGMVDGVISDKSVSPQWKSAFNAILNSYLGEIPEGLDGNEFASKLPIQVEDYYNFSSFTHHPFYDEFILEIPDNYSNGSFHNMKIEELVSIANYALDNGYTLAWDGDVSEKGFSARNGIAVLPENAERKDLFENIGKEKDVSQEGRQRNFESYATTDDHLMHVIGKAKDQAGSNYFIIKNSWGQIGDQKGYLYMSENYFKMKTVALTVHKGGVPSDLMNKIN